MDSMPPSHLADFLRRPDVIDDNPELCLIYSNYMKTQMFLETVRLERVHDVLTRAPLTFGFLTPLLSTGGPPSGGEAPHAALRLAHGPQQLHEVRGQQVV